MAYLFVKVLKWFVSVSFFILGIYLLRQTTENDDIRPLILVIFSLGVVYWMSKETYEASKKVFLIGLGVVLLAGVAARLLVWPMLMDADVYIGYYMTWELCALAVGIPVMTYVFWKEE